MTHPGFITFDAHLHIMTAGRLRSGWRWAQQMSPHAGGVAAPLTPPMMLRELQRSGVRGGFNFFFPLFPGSTRAVNEWNDGLCAPHTGLVPFLSLYPDDTPEERAALVQDFIGKRHFPGLKIHSYVQKLRLDLPWVPEVCGVLAEYGRLLVVHTGFAEHYGYGTAYNEVEMAGHIEELLRAFPRLRIVAAHMFWPRIDIAFALMERYPNLLLDTAGVPERLQRSGTADRWVPQWEAYADRILFGSDFGLWTDPLDQLFNYHYSLSLSEGAFRQIGGGNARRLMASMGDEVAAWCVDATG